MLQHSFIIFFKIFIFYIDKLYYYILDVQKKKGLKKTLADHAGANISEQ